MGKNKILLLMVGYIVFLYGIFCGSQYLYGGVLPWESLVLILCIASFVYAMFIAVVYPKSLFADFFDFLCSLLRFVD